MFDLYTTIEALRKFVEEQLSKYNLTLNELESVITRNIRPDGVIYLAIAVKELRQLSEQIDPVDAEAIEYLREKGFTVTRPQPKSACFLMSQKDALWLIRSYGMLRAVTPPTIK